MNTLTVRGILFVAVFCGIQGLVVPWVVSNDDLPLWVDIGMLSSIFIMWAFAAGKAVTYLHNLLSNKEKVDCDE